MGSSATDSAILELTQRIRDHINDPRIQFSLIRDKARWYRLCASLDAIDDCELAIQAYETQSPDGGPGHLYLHLHGLMSAFVAQQDAVESLCLTVGVSDTMDQHPELTEIRKIRVASTGHSTNIYGRAFGSISRISMTKDGFRLLKEFTDRPREFHSIDIPKLIRDQRDCLDKVLSAALKELLSKDAAHRREFAREKLVSLFPSSLGYHLEKLHEGLRHSDKAPCAVASLEVLRKVLGGLVTTLEKRGLSIQTYDSLKYGFEEVGYPLAQLERYFGLRENEAGVPDTKAAVIFVHYLETKFKEFREVAAAIDEDYEAE